MSGLLSYARDHRGMAITASIVVIAIAMVITVRQFLDTSGQIKARESCWYTTDDGATWFADKANRMPFEVNGKPAYQVHVFDDGSGKPIAGYLARFNPQMAKQIIELRGSADVPGPEQMMSYGRIASVAREVKRPGDAESPWVRASTEQGMRVMSLKGRTNGSAEVAEVFP